MQYQEENILQPHINQWYRNPLLIIDPDYPNGLLEQHTYLDVEGMREEKLNQILCNG